MKGNDSATLATIPARLPGLSSQHFVLDMIPVTSYGTYSIELIEGPTDAHTRISCLTAVYRFSYNNPSKEVDYAFVYPVVDPLEGVTGGLFNSMDPETSQRPTQNWLSIYNPGTEKFKGRLELYNQAGGLLEDRRLMELEPGSRMDYPLGHDSGEVVGMYKIIPDDLDAPYGAFLTRYKLSNNRFLFAFPLQASAGTCSDELVSASTMNPASNWAEVANFSSEKKTFVVTVYNSAGDELGVESLQLGSYEQKHVFLNQYLGASNVGSFRVSCNPQDKLFVQSLFYGHPAADPLGIEWAYGTQALGIIGSKEIQLGVSSNTYLGMTNWMKILTTDSSEADVELSTFPTGEIGLTEAFKVKRRGSRDRGVHELMPARKIGLSGLQTRSSNARYSSEILRIFPHESESIGYVMHVPAAVLARTNYTGDEDVDIGGQPKGEFPGDDGSGVPGTKNNPVIPPVSTDSGICTLDLRDEPHKHGGDDGHDGHGDHGSEGGNLSKNSHLYPLDGLTPHSQATIRAKDDKGLWSDPNTWDEGRVPAANDRVLVPKDITVVYDVETNNPPALKTLRVDGRLLFHNCRNTFLKVDTFTSTGVVRIGFKDNPLPLYSSAVIEFTNEPIDKDLDPYELGKGWLAYGPVHMYGMPKLPHAPTTVGVEAGSDSIELHREELNYWQVGDEVLVAGTNYAMDESEVRRIAAIENSENGQRVVFDKPLDYAHSNGDDRFAYHVANLTRNIELRSQDRWKPLTQSQTFGHVMFMHNPNVYIEYASFNGLGRTRKFELLDETKEKDGVITLGTNQRARYSIHFHRTGVDVDGPAAYLEGVVSRHAPSWGITNHSSNLVSVANVTYHTTGAGYMTEVSNEAGYVGKGGRYNLESLYVSTFGAPKALRGVENKARGAVKDFGVEGWGLWAGSPIVTYNGNIIATSNITYPISDDAETYLGTTHGGDGGLWVGSVPIDDVGPKSSYIRKKNLPEHLHFTANFDTDDGPAAHPKAVPYQKINDTYLYATNKIAQFHSVRAFFLRVRGVKFDENGWTKLRKLVAVNTPRKSGGMIRIDYSSQIEFDQIHVVSLGGFSTVIDRNQVTNSIRVVGTPQNPSVFENVWAALVAPFGGEIVMKNTIVKNSDHAMTLEPTGARFWYDSRDDTIKENEGFQRILVENLITPPRENGKVATVRFVNINRIRSKRFSPGYISSEYPVLQVLRNGTLMRAYPSESLPERVPFPLDEEFTGVPDVFRGKTNYQLFQEFGSGFGGYIPPSVAEDSQFPGITSFTPRRSDWIRKSAAQSDVADYTLTVVRASDGFTLNQYFRLIPGWNVLVAEHEGEKITKIVWHRTQPYTMVECGNNCPYNPAYVTSKFTKVQYEFDNGNGLGGHRKIFEWNKDEREQFPIVGSDRIYTIYFQFYGDANLSSMQVAIPVEKENS